jgi:hypothetical protein
MEVYEDHSFMLLGTISLSQLKKKKKARSDTCPQGPPSFPGQGQQRIPQIKVIILGGDFGWMGWGLLRIKLC